MTPELQTAFQGIADQYQTDFTVTIAAPVPPQPPAEVLAFVHTPTQA